MNLLDLPLEIIDMITEHISFAQDLHNWIVAVRVRCPISAPMVLRLKNKFEKYVTVDIHKLFEKIQLPGIVYHPTVNSVCVVKSLPNGVYHGKIKTLPSQDIYLRGQFKDNIPFGTWKYKNHKTSTFSFDNGMIDGTLTIEHPIGTIELYTYVAGIMEGEYKKYKNGDLIVNGFHRQGYRSGFWLHITQNEIKKITWKNGKIQQAVSAY